jgi:prepilin-type N-terminal cleavage/methylation domain-containing protein/prepilin-type processing-associated H-X9-DG protein
MDLSRDLVRSQAVGRHVRRAAMTLVELLTVVAILSVLMALLFPALNSARESARQTTCQGNLRQIGAGMHAYAQTWNHFCSGAFDWLNDGAVTEVGWVADMVKMGTPAGKMLCPSNPAQVSDTFNDLLGTDAAGLDSCVNHSGSPATVDVDGTDILNPCRKIITDAMSPGGDRRAFVETSILGQFYNTNYTATWVLVRTEMNLNASGNPVSSVAGCTASPSARWSTLGPLHVARADTGQMGTTCLPFLGCGAPLGKLTDAVGSLSVGAPTVRSFTAGPVLKTTLAAPAPFTEPTPRGGASGWWKVWARETLQDYRALGPVHRGGCNILFGDGGVRTYFDSNNDRALNNGFPKGDDFTSDQVEMTPEEVFSAWSLRSR